MYPMYDWGRSYPGLLPPVFLSPIPELDEDGSEFDNFHHSQSEGNIAEINNSSVIQRGIYNASCINDDSGIDERFRPDRVYIESCSGRKHEDVEVVKQKYINSEIQDLPRIMRGPIRYGHIHRTNYHHRHRSTYLNLGSQDIRSQMNRIRLKSRNSLPPKEYRCKKYIKKPEKCKGPRRSMCDFMYSDYYSGDDYDPEIASLFGNYMEEYDMTRNNQAEPVQYDNSYPTDYINKDNESLSERQLQLDTEHAFLCGYIEGLKQTGDPLDNAEAEKCMQRKKWINEAMSFDIDHRELISSQQDITHMSLREWEQKWRLTQRYRDDKKQKDNNNLLKEKDNLISGNETLYGDGVTKNCDKTRTDKQSNSPMKSNYMKYGEKSLADLSLLDNRSSQQYIQVSSPSFTASDKQLSETCHGPKYAPPPFHDDDESIVRLAKKKLEHKLMTSQALDDTCTGRLKSKAITNDCKPQNPRKSKAVHNSKKPGSGTTEAKVSGLHILDELDGWKTKSKEFSDQDTVQMSSSELLHKVDSSENLYVQMWSPSRSSPLFTHVNKKLAGEPRNTRNTPVLTSKPPPSTVTPMSGTLSDLQSQPSAPVKKSVKHGITAPDDYKKAANHIKLRLTKSSPSVDTKNAPQPDKPKVNLPLSKCASYNIEQNVRTGVHLTASINLSEKLAQQLKELTTSSKRTELRHVDAPHKEKPGQQTKQSAIPLSDQTEKSEGTIENKETDGELQDGEETASNLHINLKDLDENHPKVVSPIPRQKGRSHDVFEANRSESSDLPPISVRSFPTRNAQKASSYIAKAKEDPGCYGNRGIAVRAKVCMSSFTYDKEDPSSLQLEAKPLPPSHTVCTSCGGISGARGNRESGEIQKHSGRDPDNNSKAVHNRCCGSFIDEKWQLESNKKYDQDADLPCVGVEKVTQEVQCDRAEDKSGEMSNAKLQTSQNTSRVKSEEMSIRFMDKNIKFHFQCDVTVDSVVEVDDRNTDYSEDWLNSLSAPTKKERYQCPVESETRIYKTDLKKYYTRQDSPPQAPASSPYLDYCKYKSTLQEKRNKKLRERIEFLSDTCITDDVYMKSAARGRHFPVIPKRKRKENIKVVNKFTVTSPRKSNSSRKGNGPDLLIESTKPALISTIRSDPLIFSTDNFNNNGQSHLSTTSQVINFGLNAA